MKTPSAFNGAVKTGRITMLVSVLAAGTIHTAQAQTMSKSFVMSRTVRVAGVTTDAQLTTASTDKTKVETMIQYIDGLGRPVQTVQVKGSPGGNDVVQPEAYDSYGRETTKYLPYAIPSAGTSDGSFKTDALTPGAGQAGFYTSPPTGVSAIAYPYAVTNIEPSPLNRPIEQGDPGAAWQLSTSGVTGSGHTVKTDYLFNDASTHAVALYTASINSNGSRTLGRASSNTAVYSTGQLALTVTKNENWTSGQLNTTETYRDKANRVVLTRTFNNSAGTTQILSTYYVYDDKGFLAFVLTPGASPDATAAINQTTLNNLCYQYQYDEKARPMAKKLPGKGWDFIIYNILDQVVATQDSNQRVNNQWIYIKYDGVGRKITDGVWTGTAGLSRLSLQSTLSGITTNLWETPLNSGNGYTTVAWPTSSTKMVAISYYDSYALIPSLPATYSAPSGVATMTRGLLVATKTTVLNTIGNVTPDMLWTTNYYDALARLLQTYSQHYLGGSASLNTNNYDKVTMTYNFVNMPVNSSRQHYVAGTLAVTVANQLIYDHKSRKLKNWEQITNGTQTPTPRTLISQVDYNELSQPWKKHLHSTDSVTFLQNIVYSYNERGWLLKNSSENFEEQLQYNSVTGVSGISPTAQYNGNIASQSWGTAASPDTKSYVYSYDNLNRLIAGRSTDNYTERSITYDLLGNIKTLSRLTSNTLTDSLTYNYMVSSNSTNQLQSVVDASGSNTGLVNGTTNYTYDGNGSLLSNSNIVNTQQNKTLTYNLLNLPQTVTVTNGTVTYTYDGNGNKLRKVSVISGVTTTIDYISGLQYVNGSLTSGMIQTEGGKAIYSSGTNTYNYEYSLTDHLGNSRVMFATGTGSVSILQVDDYYAFGMEISRSITSPKNEYLYNNKELQEEFTQYDYGARFYDPVIARWSSVDPLAEKSRRWSPYNYVEDNPINRTDPDGMEDMDYWGRATHDQNGMYIPDGERGDKNYDYQREQDQKTDDDTPQITTTPTGDAAPTSDPTTDPTTAADPGPGRTGNTADMNNQGKYPPGLKDFIAIAAGEAAGSRIDARDIASAIINRINAAKSSLYDPDWMSASVHKTGLPLGGTVTGNYQILRHPKQFEYAKVMSMTIDEIMSSNLPYIKGALEAYNNWGVIDYSKGAYKWSATPSTPDARAKDQNFQALGRGELYITTTGRNTTFFGFK